MRWAKGPSHEGPGNRVVRRVLERLRSVIYERHLRHDVVRGHALRARPITVWVANRTGKMAAPAPPRIVIDGSDGNTLAVATIDIIDLDVVRASLHVSPGHHPAGTRARLVDAVLDDPDVACRRRAQVTIPLGDTEMLDRLRERGVLITFRAAGSTCLVEADLAGC